jgi:hypothetical protein
VEAGRAAREIADHSQLAFATENQRTLVTSDRDFIALSVSHVPHARVLLLQNPMSIGHAVVFLELFARVTTASEMRDQLRFCDW